MLSHFLCNKAGVIQLAEAYLAPKGFTYFQKTEKKENTQFPKVNASGKEGRKSLPLFSTEI